MRCLVLLLLFFIMQIISAQTEKGTIIFEANTSISFGNLKPNGLPSILEHESELTNNKLTSTSISLNTGCFIINNLSINLSLNYNCDLINYDNTNYTDGKDSYLNYGLFGRYYINNLWLWVQTGYKTGQITDYNLLEQLLGAKITIPVNTFLLDFGFSFFISPNISINPTIGATRTIYSTENINLIDEAGETSELIDLSFKSMQLQLSVGLKIHL